MECLGLWVSWLDIGLVWCVWSAGNRKEKIKKMHKIVPDTLFKENID
jgi:hypothetical protein